jgi:hypothetical protein
MTKGDRYTKIVEWSDEEAIETLAESGTPAAGSEARKHEKTDG